MAIVRNPQVTLSWLAEHFEEASAPLVEFEDFLRYLATEQLDMTGLVMPCPYCGGDLTEARPLPIAVTRPLAETWATRVSEERQTVVSFA